jgi:molybdenum cofactor cytidylyltransferase
MDRQVSALLLAAGSSKRMGQPKQLLPLNEKPLIRHCIDTIILAGIWDVAVILGEDAAKIVTFLDALSPLPLKISFNKDPGSEMADSVRIGMRTINDTSSGVLICLCDHPLVSKETLKSLINLHREGPQKIIIPVYHGKRGHPTLFSRTVIAEVFQGLTLRDIIQKDPDRIRLVEVPDEGIILDLDTMEDYRKISGRAIP